MGRRCDGRVWERIILGYGGVGWGRVGKGGEACSGVRWVGWERLYSQSHRIPCYDPIQPDPIPRAFLLSSHRISTQSTPTVRLPSYPIPTSYSGRPPRREGIANALLTTHYSLLTTHYSPFTHHSSPITTYDSLFTAYHSLRTTHYLLLTTHY